MSTWKVNVKRSDDRRTFTTTYHGSDQMEANEHLEAFVWQLQMVGWVVESVELVKGD